MEKKAKKPIFKRWYFWAIIAVLLLGAVGGGVSDNENEQDAAPEATSAPVETPALVIEYTATPESLEALLGALVAGAEDVSVFEADGGWTVEYTVPALNFLDETDLLKKSLTAYVDFCRTAYTLDGIDSVLFFVSTELRDSRGVDSVQGVFNIEMTRDVFLKYEWDNLRFRPNTLAQIEADCSVFWILPTIRDAAKLDKVGYDKNGKIPRSFDRGQNHKRGGSHEKAGLRGHVHAAQGRAIHGLLA